MSHARRFVVLLAGVVVLSACSTASVSSNLSPPSATTAVTSSLTEPPATDAPTTTEQPLKPYGGTARFWMEPISFNPWNVHVDSPVFDLYMVGALKINHDTLTVEPHVIAGIPTPENGGLVVNGDGTLTVSYAIRSSAVWADGTPISGDDFLFTYELAVDPDVPDIDRYYYELIDPDSIEVGPKTFTYTLNAVTNGWMYLFPYLVPRHDVEGSDFLNDWNERPWVSAGPFEYVSGDFSELAVFEANPNYWRVDPETGQQLPYLDRIEVGNMETARLEATLPLVADELRDAATRYITMDWSLFEDYDIAQIEEVEAAIFDAESERFLNGGIQAFDWFTVVHPLEAASAMSPLLNTPGITGGEQLSLGWEHIGFQFGPSRFEANPDSLIEHLRFRQAIAHAIDRDRIAESIWKGLVEPMDSFTEMMSPESGRPWADYEYDPDRARELLRGLCTDLGRDCEAEPPIVHFLAASRLERFELAELLVEMLADVGIEVVWEPWFGWGIPPFESTAFTWVLGTGAAGIASFIEAFDPNADTEATFYNPYRWCSPDSVASGPACDRIEEIIDEIRRTLHLEDAIELAHEAEQILADELVVIPLYRRPGRQLWRTDLIAGLGTKYGAELAPPLHGCDEWYVLEGAN